MITPTRSNTDLPNTVGNTARRDNGTLMYSEVQHDRPVEFEQHHTQQRKQWWESNYKEAAIFLEVCHHSLDPSDQMINNFVLKRQ